ncbi:Vesicle transport v-SNARE protein vti1 [Smittium mucronatum]|uniref:Vesicle transport v-SNARE protein vti1 n=1 Tax=Smittium mucronatum TaxID=133383 RepID=A0A1R0GYJ1_9FUNG|nr:Vesicle transport v-SNARE protein vti1 [Smittium mucronatum]
MNDLEQKRSKVKDLQNDLEEATELVSQMELEMLNVSGADKVQAGPKVKKYKTQVNVFKKKIQDEMAGLGSFENNRTDLLGNRNVAIGSFGIEEPGSYDQRARLLQGTASLEQSSRKLQDSHRIAIETG